MIFESKYHYCPHSFLPEVYFIHLRFSLKWKTERYSNTIGNFNTKKQIKNAILARMDLKTYIEVIYS